MAEPIDLRYDVTEEDLVAAGKIEERIWREAVVRGRLVFWLRVLPLSAVLFAVLVSIDLARDGLVQRGHVAVFVALLIACGSFAALFTTLFNRMRVTAASNDPFPRPHRLVLDDDGIFCSNDRGSISFKWANFVEVRDGDELITLVTDRRSCVFAPVRAFGSDESRREFLARARERIAANVAAAQAPQTQSNERVTALRHDE